VLRSAGIVFRVTSRLIELFQRQHERHPRCRRFQGELCADWSQEVLLLRHIYKKLVSGSRKTCTTHEKVNRHRSPDIEHPNMRGRPILVVVPYQTSPNMSLLLCSEREQGIGVAPKESKWAKLSRSKWIRAHDSRTATRIVE